MNEVLFWEGGSRKIVSVQDKIFLNFMVIHYPRLTKKKIKPYKCLCSKCKYQFYGTKFWATGHKPMNNEHQARVTAVAKPADLQCQSCQCFPYLFEAKPGFWTVAVFDFDGSYSKILSMSQFISIRHIRLLQYVLFLDSFYFTNQMFVSLAFNKKKGFIEDTSR